MQPQRSFSEIYWLRVHFLFLVSAFSSRLRGGNIGGRGEEEERKADGDFGGGRLANGSITLVIGKNEEKEPWWGITRERTMWGIIGTAHPY